MGPTMEFQACITWFPSKKLPFTLGFHPKVRRVAINTIVRISSNGNKLLFDHFVGNGRIQALSFEGSHPRQTYKKTEMDYGPPVNPPTHPKYQNNEESSITEVVHFSQMKIIGYHYLLVNAKLNSFYG